MQIIPFAEFPSFTEEITLDGTPYKVSFNWNTRGEYWTVSFTDREENVLAAGIKLVLEYELIADYPDRGLPPGHLYVIDTTNSKEPIGRNDFHNERALTLVYIPEDEVETTV